MRKKFLEAVKYADFEFLKQVVLRRHGVERLLQEKHKLVMHDMAMGKDRTAELQANIEGWRKWE
jgi:F420-dependent methylenetetrahydromethanopterin dehydrogenase